MIFYLLLKVALRTFETGTTRTLFVSPPAAWAKGPQKTKRRNGQKTNQKTSAAVVKVVVVVMVVSLVVV